ncbi:SitA6 family polymorphic toxin lipoprotein [Archangium lansingense]|uniref:TIGR02269 family lipoprotein n=1 Tax=Archangium lansingense TaxID=2995310 RepID=A0ABT4AMP4_9BACT|nr:TIGR02269 family lipoprotein [Archangium lansinium]MCY1082102.1 TIGR02269 family lipoprotein [Archangium lansinium]
MTRPPPPLRSVLLAVLLLSACAAPSPATHTWEDPQRDDPTACEAPSADQCVVLACDEGECGVFSCEDVDPEAVAQASLAHGAELARYRPPMRSPSTQRNWRRAGLRDDARPRMTFHFRYRHGFLPAFPRLEGTLIKHHLFPQAQEFRQWFKNSGIDVHAWTMAIPEQVHLRIHRGANGGLWNTAWRQFMNANLGRRVPPEEMMRKAFELAYRFDIVGPIVPYGHQVVSPGPQLFAD